MTVQTAESTQDKRPVAESHAVPVQVFQEMERRDERQILEELRGELLEEYVYSIQVQGKTVTNLSYAGVKEAIRRKGHVQILDFRVEQDEREYRAIVRVRDLDNQIDVLGASTAERDKPFAWTLSINKAERNAFAKLLPAKWIAATIAEYMGRNQPKPSGTKSVAEIPIPTSPSPAQNWRVPLTANQATPEQVKQGLRQVPLVRGTRSYGMVNILDDEISIIPERPLDISAAPVNWFIHGSSYRPGVIEPICKKHGLQSQVIEQNGKLLAIVLYAGTLEQKQIQEVAQGAEWAFRSAMEPKEESK